MQRRCGRWWALAGYGALLLGTGPVALPIWKGWLLGTLGCVLTVEAVHVLQYLGLGALAARCAGAGRASVRRWAGLSVLGATIGMCDEAIQQWLPQRVFQWSDVWLNWAGLALGLAGGWAVQRLAAGRRIHEGRLNG